MVLDHSHRSTAVAWTNSGGDGLATHPPPPARRRPLAGAHARWIGVAFALVVVGLFFSARSRRDRRHNDFASAAAIPTLPRPDELKPAAAAAPAAVAQPSLPPPSSTFPLKPNTTSAPALRRPWSVPSPAAVAAARGGGDPNLECTPAVAHYYHDGFLGGYDRSNSGAEKRMAGMAIDWHLRDFGCYTGYSVHGNGVLWTALQPESGNSQLRPTLGIDPVTGHAIDITSSKLTYMYHAHEQYNDPRLLEVLPRVAHMLTEQFGPRIRRCVGRADVPSCVSTHANEHTNATTAPHQQKEQRGDANPPPQLPEQNDSAVDASTGRALLAAADRGRMQNRPRGHDDDGGRPPEDLDALRRRMGMLPPPPPPPPEAPDGVPAPPPPTLLRPKRSNPGQPRTAVKAKPAAGPYTVPAQLGPLHVFPEGTHALVLPNQHARYIGQAFTTHLNSMARFWATGALHETNGERVIVTPEPPSPVMRKVLAWMDPLLPRNTTVHYVADGHVVYMPHSHYVTPASYEHPDPCARKFLREFLLPRAIAAVRRDLSFVWGDAATRHDPAVSDAQWARSLPTKLAVLKSKGQSREPTRVFATPPEALALFAQAGYTLVPDSSSLIHRFVLVNAAEVLVVTYGSLLTMMTQLRCRDEQHHAGNDPFRVIALAQQGYHGEEFLFAPVYMREAKEDGTRVVFANHSLINAPGAWIKHVLLMGETLGGALTLRHLDFSRSDCRLHLLPTERRCTISSPASSASTDDDGVGSCTTYHARNPRGDKRKMTFPASFVDIPGMGACFGGANSGGLLWRDWSPRGIWLPALAK